MIKRPLSAMKGRLYRDRFARSVPSKMRRGSQSRTGFTLVELIVAMAFFSFMLMIISIGVVHIMRIYQSGVASRRTQTSARAVVEEITRDTRAASRIPSATLGRNRLCLEGNNTIDYVRTSSHRLEKRVLRTPSCPEAVRPVDISSTNSLIDGDEHNVQLREFNLNPVTNSDNRIVSVEVVLVVTTGDKELLSGSNCDPAARGAQFCASTQLVGTVSLRGSDNETF